MKKLIILLFISSLSYSQVFEEDKSFEFPALSKIISSPRVSAMNFANGSVLFHHQGTYVNDSLAMTTFIWEPKTRKVTPYEFLKNEGNEPLYYSQLASNGQFIYYKTIEYKDNVSEISTLYKIDATGKQVPGFNFKENGFLYKLMELADGKILARFSDNVYKVYKADGRFEKTFLLSASGLGSDTFINGAAFLNEHYYFLLVQNNTGILSIIRTDSLLANSEKLALPKLDNASAPNSMLFLANNKVYLYTSSLNDEENHLIEFDAEGRKTGDVAFGKVGDYMSSNPEVFWSDKGAIALRYYNNDWIKINVDDTYQILPKELGVINFQKNGLFAVREGFDVFEKDLDSKSVTRVPLKFTQKLNFKPGKVFTGAEGIRMVEYLQNEQSPSMSYRSYMPNAVQFFNAEGGLLKELFDNVTSWNCISQGDYYAATSQSGIYLMYKEEELRFFDSTWPQDAEFDLANESGFYIDRYYDSNVPKSKVVKKNLNGQKDLNFADIEATNIFPIQYLPDLKKLVLFSNDASGNLWFVNPENGEKETKINVDKTAYSTFGSFRANELTPTPNGIFLRSVSISGLGSHSFNIGRLGFDLVTDKTFIVRKIFGGQFSIPQPDGSIIFNSCSISENGAGRLGFNAVKLLPTGQIDTTFAILGNDNIIHFSQQKDGIIYATTPKGLKRYVANAGLLSPYFYVNTSLPENIAWNELKPFHFKILASDSTYNVELSSGVTYRNDSLYFAPMPGYEYISVKNKEGRTIYRAGVNIDRATPYFINENQDLRANQGETWLKFKSSSHLPVSIRTSPSGPSFLDSILVNPQFTNIGIYLATQEDGYYYAANEYLLFKVQAPLSTQTELGFSTSIYPNPNSGDFKIHLPEDAHPESLELLNISGQKVPFRWWIDTDEVQVKMNKREVGPYFVMVYTSKGRFIQRLVLR